MKIREVLNADWTVSWFNVFVREERTGNCTEYIVGEGVKPPKHAKFVSETKAGDLYKDGMIHVLVIDKIIQFRHMPNKPQGKEMCVGVVEKQIPKELLDLTISHMSPSGCGKSDGMHGYIFDCYVDCWVGISGENEQISIVDFQEVMS